MENKSHLTAIGRKKASAPTRLLLELDKIKGKVLDYGCGRGADVTHLRAVHKEKVFGFDPYHRDRPDVLTEDYDTVLCNYVFNVVRSDDEQELIDNIKAQLKPEGKAYIAVRRDFKQAEYTTSKGTYQRMVELNLPIVYKTYSYCIYEMNKEE